jgi:hypothetical protein
VSPEHETTRSEILKTFWNFQAQHLAATTALRVQQLDSSEALVPEGSAAYNYTSMPAGTQQYRLHCA